MKLNNRICMTALVCLMLSIAGVAKAQGVNCRFDPYPASSVSEATSGFTHPLGSRSEKRPGYEFAGDLLQEGL